MQINVNSEYKPWKIPNISPGVLFWRAYKWREVSLAFGIRNSVFLIFHTKYTKYAHVKFLAIAVQEILSVPYKTILLTSVSIKGVGWDLSKKINCLILMQICSKFILLLT